MLNIQGEVGGNETSNIQGGIGGECCVINWGHKVSRGETEQTEGPDEVGEAARAPFRRSGEELHDAREGSPDSPANGGEFEAITFSRGVFLKGKNFHSIVIVVPLHVSKFYRVLKKLAAYSDTRTLRKLF
jgi:hypothetical protein